MDIIDKALYDFTEVPEFEDIIDAYRLVFTESPAMLIVIKDLLSLSHYASTSVCVDPYVQYHTLGMQSILKHIKNRINTSNKDDIGELPPDVESSTAQGE